VVGAGAAGLAAAIFARRASPALEVLVVDGAAKPGAKILVSGGSRCNVTNRTVSERDFHGGKPTIVRRVLRSFPVPDTIAFFAALGVPLHEEAHGKMFPDSNRARDVLDALMRELLASGARLATAARVTHVSRTPAGFVLETSGGPIEAHAVVLATGGRSLPKSGSDGHGLELARRLGHTVVPTTPALVPLVLAGGEASLHHDVSGVSQDVELSVWVDGAVRERLSGSLLWTHFGISGPVALDASRIWLRAELEGRDRRITLNLCPPDRFERVDARWARWATDRPRLSVQSALAAIVPASVAAALLVRIEVEGSMALAHLTRDARRRLAHALVEWPLDIVGSRGYSYAEVTAGGVALDEIDPASMESRRCPGLFLVGEILDVDGRIGGYNFQWAWASGRAAGNGLARFSG
jgi:predicted Rossmann fold flavoprotein